MAEEIGLSLFIPDMGRANPRFSPDGEYFAVYSQRGRLDLNRPEYSLRFYRCAEVQNFLKQSDHSQPPMPVWNIHLATDKEGQIIHDWRWLADSSGVAFLQRVKGKQQRRDPYLRCFYQNLLARGKARLQAVVAVMRKLLHALFAMFRTNQPYDGSKLCCAVEMAGHAIAACA